MPLSLIVSRKAVEAEGICSLELRAPDGAPLPPFTAGAHIDLHLPGGVVRPYSLCNDPADTRRYQIAVLREAASRGGSAAVHELLHEGERVYVGAPRNLFALDESARSHLLLAGGIGITPLLAMAERLRTIGADFQLHHATRSLARTPFRARLAAAPYAHRVHHHLDDGDAAQRLDLARLLVSPEPGRHLYVCGPQGFMQAVLAQATAAGWADDHVHTESFGAAPCAVAGDQAFDVLLSRSGRVVAVPAGRSVVQALADAGVVVATSCEQGVCGTCLTRVIDGVPAHRDQYLTPEEQAANDQFLPCCSRSQSARLVLDL